MNQTSALICLTLPGYPDPGIAIAASRSGALGLLDLEYAQDIDTALAAATRMAELGQAAVGVKIDLSREDFAAPLIRRLPREIATILIARPCIANLPEQVRVLQDGGR